jgi:hypothetical protein
MTPSHRPIIHNPVLFRDASWLHQVSLTVALVALLGVVSMAQSRGALPGLALDGTREFFAIYGIDDRQWEQLLDDQPISEQEQQLLLRVLFRLPRVSTANLLRWATRSWDEERIFEDPAEHRGEAFRVEGRARHVEVVAVPDDRQKYLGFSHFFRVSIELASATVPVVVIARSVPSCWLGAEQLDEPVVAEAVFLKVTHEADARLLMFAGSHIAWFPERVNPRLGVTRDHLFLADLRMDVGRFDAVRSRNREPITAAEHESFYELLAALGRSSPSALRDHATESFQLAPFLQSPATEHGRTALLSGTVRRVTKVLIDDDDVRERLGLDDYYQLDLFVPLDNQIIRFGEQGSAEDVPTFVNNYPVTACVLRLPPGLAEGSDLRARVQVPAVFFKLWVYRSRYIASFDERQRQLSPMFLGIEPILVEHERASDAAFSLAVGCLFLIVLGGIWLYLIRHSRSDARIDRRLRERGFEPPRE